MNLIQKQRRKKMKTNNGLTQVSGTHYERLRIEPVTVIIAFRMNWLQGEAFKYVSRFHLKNGLMDLKKAIHVLSMASDNKIGPWSVVIEGFHENLLNEYLEQFKEGFFKEAATYKYFEKALFNIIKGNYYEAIHNVELIVYSEYDVKISY